MKSALKIMILGSASLILVAGTLIAAGPLDPPTGPISSIYKTLTEVEPRIPLNATNTPGDSDSVFKITQPGSYYLVNNISVGSGKFGIEIASDRVTVDLNGYAITGVSGSFDGVSVVGANRSMITVRNGLIRSMGGDGVDLLASGNSTSSGHLVENLTVRSCDAGIRIDSGIVRQSTVSECASD